LLSESLDFTDINFSVSKVSPRSRAIPPLPRDSHRVAVSNLIITVIKNSAKSGDIFGAWIKPYKPNTELAKEDEEPEETSMMQRPRSRAIPIAWQYQI
jgi:hypothetical protein